MTVRIGWVSKMINVSVKAAPGRYIYEDKNLFNDIVLWIADNLDDVCINFNINGRILYKDRSATHKVKRTARFIQSIQFTKNCDYNLFRMIFNGKCTIREISCQ